ncbi:hypothetical protein DFH29DRAFT_982633 [Suillus ampliporus]|nr:hypothetical protein DFH29DRAFT_982633 [Suillus ampliporus]
MKKDDFEHMREHNVYYPFSDRAEWELTNFFITRFLKLLWVVSEARQPLSFKNAKQLFTFMEALPVTPKWKCTPIETDGYTTTHPVNLIWRDALEVTHHIFGNPIFANHMEYDPYEIQDNGEREYGEWMSCEHAFEIQDQLPTGASIVPIILASDKTPVTRHTGSLEMHPTFLTIGNIHSEIRMKATSHAWACITYIPTPEYIVNHDFSGVLEARLWHRCMDMVLQNLKVAAHVGEFMTDPMGCRHPWKVREFLERAKQHSLSGVHLPYWRDWRFSDPAIFLFFFDHILKWCKEVIGANELDARFRSQHKRVGMRHFADGVSHHRDIQRRLVPTIVGVTSPGFVRAVHALAPTFTDSSIGSMVASLDEFHAHKHFILEAEARTGASGPMGHFRIPKLELFNSFARSIRKSGAVIQHSADASERLLITHCKTPFTRTSHQRSTFTQQVVNVVNREDTMRQFDLYALLRERGISLVNVMDEEFNEVVDTDPMFSWIARVTPQEMHRFQAIRPVRNHFLKGILSDEASAAFHVTIAHDLADKNATTLADLYHLPHFPQMLAQFLEVVSSPNSHFHGCLLKVCNIMPSQQVQAYPPSDSHPYGNCDIVLLQPPGHDLHRADGPFLYVELFEIAMLPEGEPHIAMYRVCRLFHTAPDGSRTQVRRIVCLIDVTHAVELIPVYGVTLDRTVTSATSLEHYDDFYLNAFSDKEWYHILHADYV